MSEEYNINEIKIGDFVKFKTPSNRANSSVKDVNPIERKVKIDYFENPEKAIDRVDKWVSFDDIDIINKS